MHVCDCPYVSIYVCSCIYTYLYCMCALIYKSDCLVGGDLGLRRRGVSRALVMVVRRCNCFACEVVYNAHICFIFGCRDSSIFVTLCFLFSRSK